MERKDIICAPEKLISGVKKDKIYCFLMGPIQNAPEWQFDVPEIDNIVWLSPRRPIKIEGNLSEDEWNKQFNWETEGLRICDYVLCWIPSPSNKNSDREYARTTRSEITEILARGKNIILGISDDFDGRHYLEEKAKQYGVKIVHHTLENCLDELEERIKVKKLSIFFTSDTHFSAQRTLELSKRPFKNTSEMDWTMIERWNKIVKPEDKVFSLGDFGDWSRLKYLNGDIILVLGNYEREEMKEKDMDYVDYHDWLINDIGLNGIHLNHTIYTLNDPDVNFCEDVKLIHEPTKYYDQPKYNYCLYGHIHGRQMIKKFGLDVGVDCHNFSPISEKDVIFYLNAIKKGYYDREVFS